MYIVYVCPAIGHKISNNSLTGQAIAPSFNASRNATVIFTAIARCYRDRLVLTIHMVPIMLQQATHDAETVEAVKARPESREFPPTTVFGVDLGTMIVNLLFFLTCLLIIKTSFQLCGNHNQHITICPFLTINTRMPH